MEPREKKVAEHSASRAHISKTEIRSRFSRLREAKPPSVLKALSSRIATGICGSRIFRDSSNIALYFPVRGEADVTAILPEIAKCGKRAFLPRVCGDRLRFFEVTSAAGLLPGAFSIPEPPEDPEREIEVCELDLMVVPGVCFDVFGSRVGYGKGLYDRAACDLSPEKLCGAMYLFQFVDFELPHEPHDRRVGFMATERGVLRMKKQRSEKK